MKGIVHQINIKHRVQGSRGLPKTSVDSAQITKQGLDGDFNVYRHEILADEPDSAVLLMPLETLRELNREGWPLVPGEIGENITTLGIPYEIFEPGKRFAVGEAELTISRACDPCNNLFLLPYVGREKGPTFIKVMLGRRGWYARVVKGGVIRRGDTIEPIDL